VSPLQSARGYLLGRRALPITTTAIAPTTDSNPDLPAHARPFLKWAGGKAQLLPALLERAPRSIDTYYEPFLGGAALFFALSSDPQFAPRRAVLNDQNRELITMYEVVRDQLPELIAELEPLTIRYAAAEAEARSEIYYSVREQQPATPVAIAARLLFLNKTCFNGLYRVNQSGRFNVPHGKYKNPTILDRTVLAAASAALQNTELLGGDFAAACESAGPGDFVYFDPPFHPLSDTANFTSYTAGSFGREDQLRLKWCMDDLRARGVPVMHSNSPHEWIVGIYEGSHYRVERTPARRSINSKGDGRGAIDELIVTSDYPRHGDAS